DGFTRKWALARFFYVNSSSKNPTEMLNSALQIEIEQRLSGPAPGIDVLLVEQSGDVLRGSIDHPVGVTLALCEQVTHELGDLRERYALEVSSPGPRRGDLQRVALAEVTELVGDLLAEGERDPVGVDD